VDDAMTVQVGDSLAYLSQVHRALSLTEAFLNRRGSYLVAELAKQIATKRILEHKIDVFVVTEEPVHLEQVGVA